MLIRGSDVAPLMSASPDPSSDGTVAPTQAIIEAIAAHEGVDVTDVEPPAYDPLFTVVNPEALDRLFRTSPAGSSADARVALEYEGYEVVVYGNGTVEVADPSITRETSGSVDGPFDD